jgi:hypothetical protein
MPIIGHGDIAKALKKADKPDLLFFASGVSNSKEIREKEYDREKNLLTKQDTNKHIVYFSSLCIFYRHDRYASHKKEMETIIKLTFPFYTIIRLGNITWGKNPHTLINYFRNKIKMHEGFEVEDVYRYICDEDEFIHWINMIPEWNCEINITGKRLKVADIIRLYANP